MVKIMHQKLNLHPPTYFQTVIKNKSGKNSQTMIRERTLIAQALKKISPHYEKHRSWIQRNSLSIGFSEQTHLADFF